MIASPLITDIRAEYSGSQQCVNVYVFGQSQELNPKRLYLAPAEMVEIPDCNPEPLRPSFQIRDQHFGTLQSMFNQLYKMGYRPDPKIETNSPNNAMKDHLEDMRKLVFDSNMITWKKVNVNA